jgi:hypothetical protein
MGFFRRKKSAPLSTIMYRGDNATPARRGGKSASAAPLTPDTENASADAPVAKSAKRGSLFHINSSKPKKDKYVKVTPDKRDAAVAVEQSQQEDEPTNERSALITPSKPANDASAEQGADGSNYCMPGALIDESEASIPALMTPGSQYEGLPPTPDEKGCTKRNLNSAFQINSRYQQQAEVAANENSNNDKKLFKRLRQWHNRKAGSSPNNKMEQKIMALKLMMQQHQEKNKEASPVPKVIDHSEEGSVPSLITEMTGQSLRKSAAGTGTAAAALKSQQQPSSTADPNATNAQRQTFFGPAESFSTTSKSHIQSSRQPCQELTIGQKFLSLLSCGQDTTTLDHGYFGRIKCLDLCGSMSGKRDGLRFEREEEARFVVQFMNVSWNTTTMTCDCSRCMFMYEQLTDNTNFITGNIQTGHQTNLPRTTIVHRLILGLDPTHNQTFFTFRLLSRQYPPSYIGMGHSSGGITQDTYCIL